MTEFKLSKRNLPYDILVWKEIARRLLSSRNYSYLLKHRVILKKVKDHKWYSKNGHDRVTGCYRKYAREITMRTSNGNLLTDNAIYVWVHEFAHMVWHRDRRVRRKRSRVHAKAFKNLENRLWTKYKKEVKPELPKIIQECQEKEVNFREVKRQKKLASEKDKERKQTIEYKLEKVLELKKKWLTKQKRVNTALKKLNRKEKLYNTLLKKR